MPDLPYKKGGNYLVYGYVYLDGNAVAGATVDAVSAGSNYSTSNVTDGDGLYALYLPEKMPFNITARYHELRHTIWPVLSNQKIYHYDYNLTWTPKSFITGTGIGGGFPPPGYNPSELLNGYILVAYRSDGKGWVKTVIQSDKSYCLEVEPGLPYLFHDPIFTFHNYYGYLSQNTNITVGPNETVIFDYVAIFP